MKRPRRLWWKAAGLLLAALAAFAAAVVFSGAPVVRLEFVEYAKRPAWEDAPGIDESLKAPEMLVAVVRITNKSGSEVQLNESVPYASSGAVIGVPALMLEFRPVWNSTLPVTMEANEVRYEEVMMSILVEPWITEFSFRREGRLMKIYRTLIENAPEFIGGFLLRVYSPWNSTVVRLGPVTNLPSAELLASMNVESPTTRRRTDSTNIWWREFYSRHPLFPDMKSAQETNR